MNFKKIADTSFNNQNERIIEEEVNKKFQELVRKTNQIQSTYH